MRTAIVVDLQESRVRTHAIGLLAFPNEPVARGTMPRARQPIYSWPEVPE